MSKAIDLKRIAADGSEMDPLRVTVRAMTGAMMTDVLDRHAVAELPEQEQVVVKLRSVADQFESLAVDIGNMEGITGDSKPLVEVIENCRNLKYALAEAEDKLQRVKNKVNQVTSNGGKEPVVLTPGESVLAHVANDICRSYHAVIVATGKDLSCFSDVCQNDYIKVCETVWEVNSRFLSTSFPAQAGEKAEQSLKDSTI